MRFGRFDDKQREYVITRPDTPLPWINYLGCEAYFGIISNTAGGYSFYKDARLRRITRYRYNNVPFDMGGRYIYIRDNAGGKFWSPSWMPTRHAAEKYSCRHGLGYTVIGSTYEKIEAQTRYFVPAGRKSGNLADARSPTAGRRQPSFPSSPRWNSACGTGGTTRRTSSATSLPVRWKSRTG